MRQGLVVIVSQVPLIIIVRERNLQKRVSTGGLSGHEEKMVWQF